MAKEKELNVEERLKALYELQTILSEVAPHQNSPW